MKRIIFFLAIATVFTACGGSKTQEQETKNTEAANVVTLTDAQFANAGVQTGKLEKRAISSILKVNGAIDVPPQNMVSISVPLGGYLKSTRLLPGMHVNNGESIAVMEDQQYIQIQQDYLTAKARLVYAKQDFERQKELNQSKATSDKAFQQSQADYTSLEVLVNSLSEKLKLIGINPSSIQADKISRNINIPSPITGFVTKVNVNIGKYVNPADVLFEIVNPADIHLALNVFEKDVNKLFIGQKLLAYTNSNPEKKYPCEIILIGKDFGEERNVQVHCHFREYDKTLIPGMFMSAEIEVKSNDALVLPADAVVSYENKQFVFIEKAKQQYEMIEVKTGNTENGFVEMTVDEKYSNAAFVTKGAYTLLMTLKNTADE